MRSNGREGSLVPKQEQQAGPRYKFCCKERTAMQVTGRRQRTSLRQYQGMESAGLPPRFVRTDAENGNKG